MAGPPPGSLGLTNAQQALWASQLLHSDTALYNMAFTFTIDGGIDEQAFVAAFSQLVVDADSLRTVVRSSDGVPYQQVLPDVEFLVPVVDLSSSANPTRAAVEWAQERCVEPLRIEERSFDAALLRLTDDRHVWFLSQHHVVADAAAFAVLFNRMEQLYESVRLGVDPPANPIPPFAGYVEYEASIAAPTAQQTPGVTDAVALPLYGTQPTDVTTSNERVPIDLAASHYDDLRDLASRTGVRALTSDLSMFQVLATAFSAFLHRIGGQTSVTIGAPVHNRSTADFKRSAGLFMEVYPLAVEVADTDTFASLYDKVRTSAATMMRSAKPGHSSTEFNRHINTVFNYITARFDTFAGLPTSTEWLHSGSVDAHHHLRFQCHDFAGSGVPSLAFDCSTDVFSASLRSAMPGHFARIVDAMVADWDRPIQSVDLLDSAERAAIVAAANPVATVGTPSNVVSGFLEMVRANPDATALIDEERSWSYSELDRLTSSFAVGIEAASVVGIALPRSAEAVAAILGVLRAGAAYVPIDPSWPTERIQFVVATARCSVVVADAELDVPVPVRHFDQILGDQGREAVPVDASDLAYVLFTSGSTGEPKGVMIEHGSLAGYVAWASGFYDQGRGLAFPLFTPLTFDLTLTSIFVPLVSGGSIRVYGETAAHADLAVLDVFADDAVDIVKLTPSHLALLPDKPPARARIQQLILGGEDLSTAAARRASARSAGQLLIHNEYGPTEATVGCIVHTFDPSHDREGSVPIGKPVTGMRAYVLDGGLHPVPFGVAGELFVSGSGLARGYIGRPELDTERFVSAGHLAEDRLYSTGDLASIRPDGTIEYLGRRDDQVKIRGVRVELGEIEAAVASHPDIVASTVSVWTADGPPAEDLVHCVRCGLASDYPGVSFDADRVCNQCVAFAEYGDRAQVYFKPEEELGQILRSGRSAGGEYDCLSLLSGGKDSTYVLARLADMGLRVLAFTLDNGYISEEAKGNISRVVEALGVDHMFASTPAMNEIFVDSLQRHANVCQGCFKTIYTLSTQTAREKRIPFIVTGLSRGQFFETRLTEELFTDLTVSADQIDASVLEARKAYHKVDDAVNRLLDVAVFDDDGVFDEVRYVDFYRYVDVGLDELYSYLDERLPWIRPSDTGRSTNCLINDVGIYYHRKVRGHHNYALPYSWDVRMGHKTREEALAELDDEIDVVEVARILEEIGFPGDITEYESGQRLVSYYVSAVEIPTPVLKDHVSATLPHQIVPSQFVRLDSIPLTSNGKVDKRSLPSPEEHRRSVATTFVAASTPEERGLVAIWEEVLGVDGIGVRDNYFDLGGDSIAAIQIIARANGAGLAASLPQLFEALTVEGMTQLMVTGSAAAGPVVADVPEPSPVSATQLDQLAALLQDLEERP